MEAKQIGLQSTLIKFIMLQAHNIEYHV